MDFVFEVIMEILVEGVMEGFVALVEAFLPNKVISDKTRKVLSFCLMIVAVILAFGTFVGAVLLIETNGKHSLGWWLVGAGAVYLACGISLKIWVERKKEKRGPEL